MTMLGDMSAVAPVASWSGLEVRALREARRMSVREFAAHLGVSDRMVSKWEAAGASIRPRPVNQEALDTSLARAGAEVRARFASAIPAQPGQAAHQLRRAAVALLTPATIHLVVHPADGKVMTLVDAGVFKAGEDGPSQWQQGFYLDVYPTTNADYARFATETGHPPPAHWGIGRCPQPLLNHPVTRVSWWDATAYATWAGKSLPTGREWERAARGPTGTRYPWGESAEPTRCNVWESGVGTTTPVDRFDGGVSFCGAYDLCGNVWEWCTTATGKGRRQIKGGSFTSPAERAAPSARTDARADSCRRDIGFRCTTRVSEMIELLST